MTIERATQSHAHAELTIRPPDRWGRNIQDLEERLRYLQAQQRVSVDPLLLSQCIADVRCKLAAARRAKGEKQRAHP
jgi:hypothetical protein